MKTLAESCNFLPIEKHSTHQTCSHTPHIIANASVSDEAFVTEVLQQLTNEVHSKGAALIAIITLELFPTRLFKQQ